MKKLFLLACTLMLGASLSFAQATAQGGDTTTKPTTKSSKKSGKAHTHHKGGKKSKKGSTDTATPPK